MLRSLGVNARSHDFTHSAGTLGLRAAQGDEVTLGSVRPRVNRSSPVSWTLQAEGILISLEMSPGAVI